MQKKQVWRHLKIDTFKCEVSLLSWSYLNAAVFPFYIYRAVMVFISPPIYGLDKIATWFRKPKQLSL